MTVPDQTPITRSTGNGVTTVFAYGFKILAAEDLLVEVDDVALSYPADYSVSGVGVDGGGSITCAVAPASGATVVRRLNMAFERETDYQDQGELPTQDLDDDFDRAVLLLQQLREILGRSLTLPPSYSGASTQLPIPEALSLIGWNSAGDGLANYAGTSSVPVSSAMAPVVAAATLILARAAMGAAASGAIGSSGLTMNTARALGRSTAGIGAPEEWTAAQMAAFVAAATTSAQGAVRLATTAEAAAGTATDRALTPAALRGGPIQSMVRLNTANGYGSTNTVIKRYSTVVTNVGSDITYADSATLGASFTITNAGVYGISVSTNSGGTFEIGVSLNSSQLSTAISSITQADRLGYSNGTNVVQTYAAIAYLPAGTVVRSHGNGAAAAGVDQFTITRIA